MAAPKPPRQHTAPPGRCAMHRTASYLHGRRHRPHANEAAVPQGGVRRCRRRHPLLGVVRAGSEAHRGGVVPAARHVTRPHSTARRLVVPMASRAAKQLHPAHQHGPLPGCPQAIPPAASEHKAGRWQPPPCSHPSTAPLRPPAHRHMNPTTVSLSESTAVMHSIAVSLRARTQRTRRRRRTVSQCCVRASGSRRHGRHFCRRVTKSVSNSVPKKHGRQGTVLYPALGCSPHAREVRRVGVVVVHILAKLVHRRHVPAGGHPRSDAHDGGRPCRLAAGLRVLPGGVCARLCVFVQGWFTALLYKHMVGWCTEIRERWLCVSIGGAAGQCHQTGRPGVVLRPAPCSKDFTLFLQYCSPLFSLGRFKLTDKPSVDRRVLQSPTKHPGVLTHCPSYIQLPWRCRLRVGLDTGHSQQGVPAQPPAPPPDSCVGRALGGSGPSGRQTPSPPRTSAA